MPNYKPWYFSKSIWGSLIAVAAGLTAAFGVEIDDESQSLLLEAIMQLIAVGGSLFAIFGRLTAQSQIS
ncbi:MAG: hypothetical protein AAGF28_03935 [Pseudomonadota bacterium]